MKIVLAIARRELEEYFATPLGWVCLFCFMSITVYSIYSPLKTVPDNQLQWLTQFQVRC